MDKQTIQDQLNKIFINVMDNEDIKLEPSTSARDIDEWDSLSHIQLVVAIEKHYNIKFPTSEMQKWKTVGEIVDSTEKRVNEKA